MSKLKLDIEKLELEKHFQTLGLAREKEIVSNLIQFIFDTKTNLIQGRQGRSVDLENQIELLTNQGKPPQQVQQNDIVME